MENQRKTRENEASHQTMKKNQEKPKETKGTKYNQEEFQGVGHRKMKQTTGRKTKENHGKPQENKRK